MKFIDKEKSKGNIKKNLNEVRLNESVLFMIMCCQILLLIVTVCRSYCYEDLINATLYSIISATLSFIVILYIWILYKKKVTNTNFCFCFLL